MISQMKWTNCKFKFALSFYFLRHRRIWKPMQQKHCEWPCTYIPMLVNLYLLHICACMRITKDSYDSIQTSLPEQCHEVRAPLRTSVGGNSHSSHGRLSHQWSSLWTLEKAKEHNLKIREMDSSQKNINKGQELSSTNSTKEGLALKFIKSQEIRRRRGFHCN